MLLPEFTGKFERINRGTAYKRQGRFWEQLKNRMRVIICLSNLGSF